MLLFSRLTFSATSAGSYNLYISLANSPVGPLQSYPILISAGALEPTKTILNGPPSTGVAGQTYQAYFQVFDRFMNPTATAASAFYVSIFGGLQNFTGTVAGTSSANIFIAMFTTTVTGNYVLNLGQSGISGSNASNIVGFPIAILPGPVDPTQTLVAGPGLSAAIAGQSANFTVRCTDDLENTLRAGFYKL